MLTREHGIAVYERGRILPDRLTTGRHGHYLSYAKRMLKVYQGGTGQTRQTLHRRVREIFAHEDDCPSRRIEAFCKLLDDESRFIRDPKGKAAKLRRRVFRLAAPLHPLVQQADRLFEQTGEEAKVRIAAELGMEWAEIEAAFFSDMMEFHCLKEFHGYADGAALLSRYNVAQVQVALYSATSMVIRAEDDFKTILRHAKLAGLLHRINRISPVLYEIHLDGPASMLRQTRRYGVFMAGFLPKLIACKGWSMRARLLTPRKGFRVTLALSPEDGLTSHLSSPNEFDSGVEEAFAAKWGDEPRQGWRLIREGEVLHKGQKVFVPDFVFEREDGRRVIMEVVGFWTSEYLREKVKTLRAFREHNIILAVGQAGARRISGLPPDTIYYKSALKIKDVLERLENA
jgi:predicted nuclease of restriction endonuclease-like RecB superfamily